MFSSLSQKKNKIAVVGLGYVGLPIALEFARKFSVIGYDINPKRVDMMKKGVDPSQELPKEAFQNCDIHFTANENDLKEATFFIVAVPTPLDEHNYPNLNPLFSASKTIGRVIKKGDVAVFESTVYPGCTEEDCIPLIEEESGLKYPGDFMIGYSPERINPGDKEHTLTRITKVVSGGDEKTLELVASVYNSIIEAGVFKAASIKVAESAKIIENTQRDLNIALMNELSIIFNKAGVNTYDVLEAARTKWNFLPFFPGLVGGHCIGVDPYYLTHKASELGYHSRVILAGRYINDYMPVHIAKETVKTLINHDKKLKGSKVLVMGATFKENVSDIRNSKVADVVKELQSYSIDVDITDPHASPDEFMQEYNLKLSSSIGNSKYDAVILAVPHKEYLELNEADFINMGKTNPIFIDIKGVFKNKIQKLPYWSL